MSAFDTRKDNNHNNIHTSIGRFRLSLNIERKLLCDGNKGSATCRQFPNSAFCASGPVGPARHCATLLLAPASGTSESLHGSISGALWERKRGWRDCWPAGLTVSVFRACVERCLTHQRAVFRVAAPARRVPVARLQAQSRITSHLPQNDSRLCPQATTARRN